MLMWVKVCVVVILAAAMTYILLDSIRKLWIAWKHWKESRED